MAVPPPTTSNGSRMLASGPPYQGDTRFYQHPGTTTVVLPGSTVPSSAPSTFRKLPSTSVTPNVPPMPLSARGPEAFMQPQESGGMAPIRSVVAIPRSQVAQFQAQAQAMQPALSMVAMPSPGGGSSAGAGASAAAATVTATTAANIAAAAATAASMSGATPGPPSPPHPMTARASGQGFNRSASSNGLPTSELTPIQVEIQRRQAAEVRVRDLEVLVNQLRRRIAGLEAEKRRTALQTRVMVMAANGAQIPGICNPKDMSIISEPPDMNPDDAIDKAICEYLRRNPDFPVSIQKVAPNYYVFGDRGTVYVTERGRHIVVRVGGGFKSLQVFMDERALMLTRETAGAWSERAMSTGVMGQAVSA
eukprot:CAMPEP_0206473322 /NCGR_PEP_ID=MMETSP0324_2-20121206/32783_1 /ASSEMBLY_ACC=CAM_ASM_000836 /TAXON_ID=2866 /ORGANISM="Crypthecodinium cohnii, Strain Seligo" /LENGTH=363 /DNA_ID=CAMNT_0053948203 /DNA_START=64 /DNA_END=1155 /DNA_ORIENTATION=+